MMYRWRNPYVTNGLVAMWDGEWNAGGGVHDPNATVWKDLTEQTGNAVKVGSPTWTDNAGVTNGIGNTFLVAFDNSSPIISAIKGGAWTIEICFSHDYTSFGSRCPFAIEDSSGTSSTYRILQIFQNATTGYSSAWLNANATNLQSSVNGSVGSQFGTYVSAVSFASNTFTISPYWNGEAGTTGTQSSLLSFVFLPSDVDSLGVSTWYMRIGRTHNSYMNARFHSIRFYDHVLSASGVAANALIDQRRFAA